MNDMELNSFLVENNFSGNVFIGKGPKVLFEKSFGLANREFNIENNKETIFALASITKMFTAISILQLVASNKCNLISPISEYITLENLNNYSEVTIKDLLTHSSGLPDYIDEYNPDSNSLQGKINSLNSIDDYIELIKFSPHPTAKRGTFHYNNYGFIILGKIIENITGQSYYSYVQENIFLTAHMQKTSFYKLDDIIPNRSEGYYQDAKGIWKRNLFAIPFIGGSDGGAYSTIEDLNNFITAINKNILLSKEYTELFLSPQQFDYENKRYIWKYGFGNWFLLSKDNIIVRWGHPGEDKGVSTRLSYFPEKDITVIVLSNVTDQAEEVLLFIRNNIISPNLP